MREMPSPAQLCRSLALADCTLSCAGLPVLQEQPTDSTSWDVWLGFPALLSRSQGLFGGVVDQGGQNGKSTARPYLSVPDKSRRGSSRILSRMQLCRKMYWDWKAKADSSTDCDTAETAGEGGDVLCPEGQL